MVLLVYFCFSLLRVLIFLCSQIFPNKITVWDVLQKIPRLEQRVVRAYMSQNWPHSQFDKC